ELIGGGAAAVEREACQGTPQLLLGGGHIVPIPSHGPVPQPCCWPRCLHDMRFVAHESAKTEPGRAVNRAHGPCQFAGIGESAPMQANIDLQIDTQPALLCPGKTFIGCKPLPGMHQPLQLLLRPETAGAGCQLPVETVNGG